jgi:hypothetical protein
MWTDARVEESKFDFGLGLGGAKLDSGEFPWAYGDNRITAVVRDPESAYLYWEITDDAIAAARTRLGPAGAHGWCCLRVYDTTSKRFDGTNANDYFDIRVDRTDREYFLMIRRPTSIMHAEIGLKTEEGFFQPIARSGAAEFPRNAPSPNTSLEWMTVTTDDVPPAVAPYRSRYTGPPPSLPERAGAGYVDVWRAAYAPSMQAQANTPVENASSSGAGIHRTYDRSAHIERWWHLDEWRSEWRGGLRFIRRVGAVEDQAVHWKEGPFPIEFGDPERFAVELLGEPPVQLRSEGMAFTVYGPWRVSIRSFDGDAKRRILSTWSIRWVRATTPMIERWGFGVERHVESGYEHEHVVIGASEQHGLLERGASERWRIGASERMWLGASEWAARGGSETLHLGASQFGFAGASALLYRGASEWVRMGASEWMRMGASEWMRMGGSERVWLGASEEWRMTGGASMGLGGSEAHFGGASEAHHGGASEAHHGGASDTRFNGTGYGSERWGGRLEEV